MLYLQLCDHAKMLRDLNIQLNDIKADNVLLDGNNGIIMIDLGNARYVGETAPMGFTGTPEEAIKACRHVAPELFLTSKVHAVSQNYFILICYLVKNLSSQLIDC